jgi:hypothetical protein
MDDQTKVFLRSAFQFLENHERMHRQEMIVTFALRNTVRELGPDAEKIYAKHYQAASQGQIKTDSDVTLQSLAQLLTQLGEVN